ncbi:hypothetical protein ACFWDI_06915 [Streptomyces sp. NPDC060064]|uniref:hypothetical protein n=1 Tax=Streptomyces sp. NPDC060064 TaxID=3347049 RepID=UPI00367CA869
MNLSNDSGGIPMFTVTNMIPGDSGERCIAITSNASVPVSVKLYGQDTALPSNDIDDFIDITIEDGTGGSFASCTGFVPSGAVDYTGTLHNFVNTRTNYATGVGPWALAASPPARIITYRIRWTFNAAAPASTQGGTTPNVAFIWEAQSA